MNQTGPEGMWDEEDGFYYDVLRLPDGSSQRLKVRSMVGLLPLCATTVIEPWQRERVPGLAKIMGERLRRMPELLESIHPTGPGHLGYGGRGIAALVNPDTVAPDSDAHARRERVPRAPMAFGRSPSITTSIRLSSM